MTQYFRILWLWLKRDIKSRYAGSWAGALWAILSPLATIALFYVMFATIFKVKVPELASDAGFFYYLLVGILPWLAVNDAIARATGVIVGYEQFLQKQVFPVSILPMSVILAALLPQLIGTVLQIILLWTGGIGHPLRWLAGPFLFALQVLMMVGIGLVLSVASVHMRDLMHGVPVVMSFIFYATPILFPISMVPEAYRMLFMLNPFACLIETYHAVFLGTPLNIPFFIALLAWSLILGLGGILLFRILKPTLGEAL